jgi:hypothetical protein
VRWVKTTTTKHPAPRSCRKEYTVLPLKNKTAEPENRMHTGTNAASPLSNVMFMEGLLGTAAQEAVVVAVPVGNVTAAERSSRAIKKFIAGAATVRTIEAAVLYAAVGAKSQGQVIRGAPISQESTDWRVAWLACAAGRNSSPERQPHNKQSCCGSLRETPAAKYARKTHRPGRPIGSQNRREPGCGINNHAVCSPLIP